LAQLVDVVLSFSERVAPVLVNLQHLALELLLWRLRRTRFLVLLRAPCIGACGLIAGRIGPVDQPVLAVEVLLLLDTGDLLEVLVLKHENGFNLG
jgi:hypothetical protein